MRQPRDPIEALAPSDQDEVAWLVPGRIQLEPGGAITEAPGGNRPIEVALIDEQGSKVRVALQLEDARFSVWSDRSRLLPMLALRTVVAAFPGGSGPSAMTIELDTGAKVKRLARKGRWTQIRYIGALSAEGWVLEETLVASWPRSRLRRGWGGGGRRSLMTSPGTVIRAEPKWSGRQLAVVASSAFLEALTDRDDGWTEVRYSDREIVVHGYLSKRDPPGRAHRFSDPDSPPATITPNAKLANGTCLLPRPGGDAIGYVVGDRDLELAENPDKLGWWWVAINSPWGPIAFAARGPDAQSLERCGPTTVP